MRAEAIANTVDVVTQVRDAVGRQAFEHAVGKFAQLLGRLPDAAPGEISLAEIGLMRTIAEEVIERIEARVERATVCGRHEQMLISNLYEIRRLLEEIHQWQRHFASRRRS